MLERPIRNQFVFKDEQKNVEVWLKREDLVHPFISGNKFRKLKYNLQEAKNEGKPTLLTFGGAFSNHIAATAAAAQEAEMKVIGVIRGEELGKDLVKTIFSNPTLNFAHQCGMELHFISREDYRLKNSDDFIQKLRKKFGDFYLIPEGGTNLLAIKGCEEILTDKDKKYFDLICCPVGTGGTISGIINSSLSSQQVIGFSALKGDFLKEEVAKNVTKNNWKMTIDYHFGGYAKVNKELIVFVNDFLKKYHIPLDPIYTGKMMFGIFDMLKNEKIKENTRILAIHTGGLQGIPGMNKTLTKKGLPTIEVEL